MVRAMTTTQPFTVARSRPFLTAALAWGLSTSAIACAKPSVQGKVDESRAEIVAYIDKVRAVRDKLGSAPTTRDGFTTGAGPKVSSSNTVIVAENDFDELRTDTQKDRNDRHEWEVSTTPRPWSSYDLAYLVDAVRALPINPPETGQSALDVTDRALGKMRSTAYVAVVRTDKSKSAPVGGSLFTAGSWNGNVVVWDLANSAWVGGVSISVTDSTTETTVGGNDYAQQLNRRVCAKIGMTVFKALDAGTSQTGQVGQ